MYITSRSEIAIDVKKIIVWFGEGTKCFVQILCGKKLQSFRVNDLKRIISSVVYNLFQVIDMKTLYFHANLLMYKILL